jgi:sulfur relay (sulfurtransferase) DsrF/TusC family protein
MGIVVRRAPFGTINAAEAVRHAAGGLTFGVATTLVLLDDGVYVARDGQDGERIGFTSLSRPLAQCAQQEGTAADGRPIRGRVLVHGPSLAERGLSPELLVAGAEVMDDAGLAWALAEFDAVLTY